MAAMVWDEGSWERDGTGDIDDSDEHYLSWLWFLVLSYCVLFVLFSLFPASWSVSSALERTGRRLQIEDC